MNRWKVYCDSYLLYSSSIEEYKVIDPTLTLELNKTGTFTFKIYPEHPNYDKLQKLKSIITVYQDDYLYFRGRILNDTLGFYNERQVSCEGELAFFLDSIQRPFRFPENEGDTATPEALFAFLVNRHNEQVDASRRFVVGNVTVTDPNGYISRYDSEYSATWDILKEGLVDSLGGYLWVDFDDSGNRRINYYADFNILSSQKVEFGRNLLDLARERKGEEIATAILPLGAKLEDSDERTTIASLADESSSDVCKAGDIVYSAKAEAQFGGRITKRMIWDDVTSPSNLLRKAKEKLASAVLQTETLELSAADLGAAGEDCNCFRLGTYIVTKSGPHGIDDNFLVKKLSIKPDNPTANKLTIGATGYSFVEKNWNDTNTQNKFVESSIKESQSTVIAEMEKRLSSAIEQSERDITQTVKEGYYTKGETDTLISGVSTTLQQTAQGWDFKWTSMEQDAAATQQKNDAQFKEIEKHIRFVNGVIVLGEERNPLTLEIQNDRISFKQSGAEVAYFSQNKLYVTDAEFLVSLKLGKFAFMPRANGLDFRKVAD